MASISGAQNQEDIFFYKRFAPTGLFPGMNLSPRICCCLLSCDLTAGLADYVGRTSASTSKKVKVKVKVK